jgi:hypothetical protein
MITISRLSARRIRSVLRRALGLSPSMLQQPVRLTAGPQGLRVFASHGGFAAQYTEHASLPVCDLAIPLSALKEAEGNKAEPVSLVPSNDGEVIVRWQDGAIPQQRSVTPSAPAAEIIAPELPATWVENASELRRAIVRACAATDASSSRYALGCLQLRGQQGDITATDGRQIYRQSGFAFGTEQSLLVRPSSVFAAKELDIEQPVRFGTTAEHVVLTLGPWTIWLPIEKEARFPQIDDVIQSPQRATTTLALSRLDAAFLADNLRRLPGSEDFNQPVTLDLNGCVAVRGRASDSRSITELRLAGSQRIGEEIRVHTNRRFLERAARLGFERMSLFAPDAPIVCQDEHRTFVWAVLGAADAIKSSEEAVVIESPVATGSLRSCLHRSPSRRCASMATRHKRLTSTPVPVETPVSPASTMLEVSAIDQVIALRTALRDALGKVKELVRAIKRQKKQEQALRSTLASLRRLPSAA